MGKRTSAYTNRYAYIISVGGVKSPRPGNVTVYMNLKYFNSDQSNKEGLSR